MEHIIRDLRLAFRTLRRTPTFSLVAVATLAIGIGANTSLFSVVNGALLRPLALHDPERLVSVFMDHAQRGWRRVATTGPDFAIWTQRSRTFAGIAATTGRNVELTGRGEPTEVYGVLVSREFFTVVPARPIVGRTFSSEEATSRDAEVVVLGETLWRTRFGADSLVIGQRVTVNGVPRTIIGVIPAATQWPRDAEMYFALPPVLEQMSIGDHQFQVVGRLREGASREQAAAELNTLSAPLDAQRSPSDRGWTVGMVPIHDEVVGNTRRGLVMLLAAVGFVLLLSCANLAGLQLARASARAHEVALRRALGGTRARIISQVLAESALLALGSGALGVLLAMWGVDLLRGLGPDAIPRLEEIRVDRASLAYTAVITLAAAILSGLAPALLGARADVHSVLKESGRALGAGRAPLLRAGLVVGEVALAVMLLVGAGLMLRSFRNLQTIPLGYDARGLIDVDLDLPARRYDKPENRTAFLHAVEERARAVPGIESVGSTRALPLESGGPIFDFTIAGRAAPAPGETASSAFFTAVTPDYFRTMRMRVVSGRGLEPGDGAAGAPLVVVVNQTMARRFWGSATPIGHRLQIANNRNAEVVGVVADVRQRTLTTEVWPAMFVPFDQAPESQISMVVRTSLPPERVMGAIRDAVWAVDPNLPVEQWTMEELMGVAVAAPRFQTVVLIGFAMMALLIAIIGVYAIVSYMVAMRTREIGVRMALGADRRKVVVMVLGHGARLTALGSLLGLGGAFALTRYMKTVLYEVPPDDPATLLSATVVLSAVAFIATYLPARRAASVEPTVALRQE